MRPYLLADIRCMQCEWTSAEDLASVMAAGPSGGYDLLLGADICYGQQSLPAVRGTEQCDGVESSVSVGITPPRPGRPVKAAG